MVSALLQAVVAVESKLDRTHQFLARKCRRILDSRIEHLLPRGEPPHAPIAAGGFERRLEFGIAHAVKALAQRVDVQLRHTLAIDALGYKLAVGEEDPRVMRPRSRLEHVELGRRGPVVDDQRAALRIHHLRVTKPAAELRRLRLVSAFLDAIGNPRLLRPAPSEQVARPRGHVGAAGAGAPIPLGIAPAALGVYFLPAGRPGEKAGLVLGDTVSVGLLLDSGITSGGSSGCLFSRLTFSVAYRSACITVDSAIGLLLDHARALHAGAHGRGGGVAEHVQRGGLEFCLASILGQRAERLGHALGAAGVGCHVLRRSIGVWIAPEHVLLGDRIGQRNPARGRIAQHLKPAGERIADLAAHGVALVQRCERGRGLHQRGHHVPIVRVRVLHQRRQQALVAVGALHHRRPHPLQRRGVGPALGVLQGRCLRLTHVAEPGAEEVGVGSRVE